MRQVNERGEVMKEIIYNESEKTGSSIVIKPPKNIRQIGNVTGRHKIYVEDYVYTFLHNVDMQRTFQKYGAILLGKSEVYQDIRYTFISGAINCGDIIFQENNIQFDENCWEYIYKEIKKYFEQEKIVGWFLGMSGFPLELTPMVEAAHRKYFSGRDKVLFMSETVEKEDVFYVYEQGVLQKKEGYYVYYEKNPAMQEYMICNRKQKQRVQNPKTASVSELETEFLQTEFSEGMSETFSTAEQSLRKYRSMLLEKKEVPTPVKMNALLYTASAVAMIVLCVIGITTMNNFEKMKQVEETLMVISKNTVEEVPENKEVIVESIPGKVVPENAQNRLNDIDENRSQKDNTKENDTNENFEEENESDTTQNNRNGDAAQNNRNGDAVQNNGNKDTTQNNESNGIQDQNITQEQETEEAMAQVFLEQGYYEVQPGDKLELICMKIYRTTAIMDKLCEINQIKDTDKIYPGQKLMLP